jgi:hypothetical protein
MRAVGVRLVGLSAADDAVFGRDVSARESWREWDVDNDWEDVRCRRRVRTHLPVDPTVALLPGPDPPTRASHLCKPMLS